MGSLYWTACFKTYTYLHVRSFYGTGSAKNVELLVVTTALNCANGPSANKYQFAHHG